MNLFRLPGAVDANLLQYLSRLHIHCADNSSFHQAIALFSSVFGQLSHLSLILEAYTLISGPSIISGDIIQQLCIDPLKPCTTYILNLLLYAANDLEEKIIFKSFFTAPFVHRQRPRVCIQERAGWGIDHNYHCFMVYNLPYNERILPIDLFSIDLEKYVENIGVASKINRNLFFLFRSCQISSNAVDLFPRANELFLYGYKKINFHSELGNCKNFISSLVPWSLLTKITIDEGDVVTVAGLESILRMAHNVHTLKIYDDREGLARAILRNTDNLGTRVNEQARIYILNEKSYCN
jgi:hypothetical protein